MNRRDVLKLFAVFPLCGVPAHAPDAATYQAVLAPTQLIKNSDLSLMCYQQVFAMGILNIQQVKIMELFQ